MALCQYKVGYLSLKGCGDPAIAQCAFCNQAVCARHMRSVGPSSACLSCYIERAPERQSEEAGKRRPEDDVEDDEMERERMRRNSYTRHGYGARSYRTFDEKADKTTVAAPIAAANFQDS